MTEVATTLRAGDTALHLHQVVAVDEALADRFPDAPDEYLVTGLGISVDLPATRGSAGKSGPRVRFVNLPLSDSSSVVTVPTDGVPNLLGRELLRPLYHESGPRWGY